MAGPYTLNGGTLDEVYKKYETQEYVAANAAGEAHCALLVQTLTGAAQTTVWKRGDKVKGLATITPGTAIASFEGDPPKYTGKSGVCHAAIYISQSATGIAVWDQWKDGHLGQRKLDGYKHGKRVLGFKTQEQKDSATYKQSNDGDAFYIIL